MEYIYYEPKKDTFNNFEEFKYKFDNRYTNLILQTIQKNNKQKEFMQLLESEFKNQTPTENDIIDYLKYYKHDILEQLGLNNTK